MNPPNEQFHPSISPTQNIALLRGFINDYANLLKANGSASTAAVVIGAGNHAADELTALIRHLERKKPEVPRVLAETDRFPQEIPPIEVGP